ncbi:MAG: O-antigen ligase family protein [Negativicutes bacterium]|nr:O-antigen ligase family protein [Negativicutes bacterium]
MNSAAGIVRHCGYRRIFLALPALSLVFGYPFARSMFVVFALWLVFSVIKENNPPAVDINAFLVISQYFMVLIFATVFSRDPNVSADYLFNYSFMPALALVTMFALRDIRDLEVVMWGFIVTCGVVSLNVLVQGFYFHNFNHQIKFLFKDYNVKIYSSLAILAMPHVWFNFLVDRQKTVNRLMWLSALIAILTAMIFTALRAVWFFIVILVAFQSCRQLRSTRRRVFTVLLVIILMASLVPVLMKDLEVRFRQSDLQDRRAMWHTAIKMGNSNILSGVGLGMYSHLSYSDEFATEGMIYFGYPHNILLSAYAESGVVGVVSTLLFWGAPLWYSRRLSRNGDKRADAFLVSWIGFWFYNLTDCMIGVRLPSLTIYMYYAATMAYCCNLTSSATIKPSRSYGDG